MAVTGNLLKSKTKLLIVIFRDIAGSVFANIHNFKKLAGIFHFPNTKILGKFELKCLMSSTFSQMSPKNFLCGYQLLQLNPVGQISQISIFANWKIST